MTMEVERAGSVSQMTFRTYFKIMNLNVSGYLVFYVTTLAPLPGDNH